MNNPSPSIDTTSRTWLVIFFLIIAPMSLHAEDLLDVDVFRPQSRQTLVDWDASSTEVAQVMMLQQTPTLLPPISMAPSVRATAPSRALYSSVFQSEELRPSALGRVSFLSTGLNLDTVRGEEGFFRATSDVGDLLGVSPQVISVSAQKKTPVVTDPRVRSMSLSSFGASGSHWVPARADLDTVLSKIDSRLIDQATVISGPYSSLYGPGFQFIDFDLAHSPRYHDGFEIHGQSSVEGHSNGGQFFGQQSVLAGDDSWGVRGTFTYRKGSDYQSGDGTDFAASYGWRQWYVAYGEDFGDGRSIEFNFLRLDQSDVEFPGYVFDIDDLATDGLSLTFHDDHSQIADRTASELWYNRTRFVGNAQNPAKRKQFPILGELDYQATTDVDSLSTGFRQGLTWESRDQYSLSMGGDLRFIQQELNEIADGLTLSLDPFDNRNSPIPESFSLNPGLFLEYQESVTDYTDLKFGARLDLLQTDVISDQLASTPVGNEAFTSATFQQIVGTDDYENTFFLLSSHAGLSHELSENSTGGLKLGYAERAPTLTDLYAAQPFLLLLQNGLNNVTGDPQLEKEKMFQFDISLDYKNSMVNTGIRGFHAWVFDYVTYENIGVVRQNPLAPVSQVNLRSVNTDLATLSGFEAFGELFSTTRVTPFATMRYVDGRDRTRSGEFATRPGDSGIETAKVAGLSRGNFSGISGASAEPLPGISPLESRIGVRIRNSAKTELWNVEVATRIVDNQDRVASSLLESSTPGFTLWDLRGTLRPSLTRDWLIIAGIENFTNKNYREHLDYRSLAGQSVLQPGVNFYLGTDINY